MTDDDYMALAMEEAAAAGARGEVPVGAVLVAADGRILARDGNRILERHDPTAHAEMLVIRAGAEALANERLVGASLFVTLEPCAMCAGAASFARLARVVFAADDPKGGAILHGPMFYAQPTCHHRPETGRAGDPQAAGQLLKDFFKVRR
jgi:tRNA(adenine34) deaminase